jgi:hypothetical protein
MINGPSTGRPIAPLTTHSGSLTTDQIEKSKLLLEQFCPTEREHRKEDRTLLFEQKIEDAINKGKRHPLNTPISLFVLEINLYGLPNKAMSRDKIHNEMLRNLNKKNRNTLLVLLNVSLETGYIPPEWKNAAVIPILKPNQPQVPRIHTGQYH